MGEVIYGVDFRKPKSKEELQRIFEQMIATIWDNLHLPDTAPSEYTAPDQDPA